jgi:NAD(P)-dependent dehydrogenase (short-subunit alcohol dehydrogenase family)
MTHPPAAPLSARSLPDLSGRRVLITGAASGIGLACAQAALVAGARVALLDLQQADLQALPEGLRAQALAVQADITDPEQVQAALAQALSHLGGLDGLVNAAGIANTDPANQVSLADWRRVIEVNLTGTFIVCQACEPHLRQHAGASIVNLSSGQGLSPSPRRSAYAASKHGVIGWTRSIAQEWGPQIRANAVCPGATDTPMLQGGYSPEALQAIGQRYSLGRIAQAGEIAATILFLLSDQASFITGVALAVDGGRTFH